MNEYIDILICFFKAHTIAILIIFISYIIEKTTKFKLLIYNYNWEKSLRNADAAATRDSGNYLIINFLVFVYDIYMGNIGLNIINIIIWLIIISILTKTFYRIHLKYQAVDIKKSDDDYS